MFDPRRRYYYGLFAILILAALWRAAMAWALPVLSRDGVTFCWYARDLGERGLAFLHDPTTRQHPLFPALILAVQRAVSLLGGGNEPLAWQRSGQLIAWLAGLAVVVLAGAITCRLVRRLQLPLDEHLAILAAMLLAAVLDLNIWLSADVMSDQIHLAFYLGAVWLLLKLDSLPAALGCGVLSGLAFLTRQEGFVPALAGLAALMAHRRQTAVPRLVARAAVLLLGFVVCAAPYWVVVGRLSAKKDPFDAFRQNASAALNADSRGSRDCPVYGDSAPFPTGTNPKSKIQNPKSPAAMTYAKLEITRPAWYALLPQAFYKLLRAGRVVVPLLALLPLLNLRRRLLDPVLAGFAACLAGHFALTLLLLERYGYLDPRHMLVIVLLLIPLAGMQLSRAFSLLVELRWPRLAVVLVAAFVLPLAVYARRVPNSGDRFIADAARWLAGHDTQLKSACLLSGSSLKRLAFYTDMRWEPWMEEPDQYARLVEQIRAAGPGYFALETGPGFELAGNRELLAKLRADETLAPSLGHIEARPGPDARTELFLIELRPAR